MLSMHFFPSQIVGVFLTMERTPIQISYSKARVVDQDTYVYISL